MKHSDMRTLSTRESDERRSDADEGARKSRKENMMRRSIRRIAVALVVVGATSLLSFAAPVRADVVSPTQSFYFAATCTGLGDVVVTNASVSRTIAFQVLGTTTVVLVPEGTTNPSGVPGLASQAAAAGTTCTFTAGGDSPDQLEPFPPITLPVVITP